MGCCCSKTRGKFEIAMETEEFQSWMAQFQAMKLTVNEVKKLHKMFTDVDVDGSGTIGLAELLAHIDMERTSFTRKIFSIFDEDNSGEIDFREFILSLWNYCTLTKATLQMFAFDLYDVDGSGEMSGGEVAVMLKEVYGTKNIKDNFLAKSVAADLAEIEKKGEILDIDQFRLFAKNHQALLFPAFQMQSALQRKIMGFKFWENNANRRIKLSHGKYISIGNFIQMNMSKDREEGNESKMPSRVTGTSLAAKQQLHQHIKEQGPLHERTTQMMELAGSRASRKQSVVKNEVRRQSSKRAWEATGGAGGAGGEGLPVDPLADAALAETQLPPGLQRKGDTGSRQKQKKSSGSWLFSLFGKGSNHRDNHKGSAARVHAAILVENEAGKGIGSGAAAGSATKTGTGAGTDKQKGSKQKWITAKTAVTAGLTLKAVSEQKRASAIEAWASQPAAAAAAQDTSSTAAATVSAASSSRRKSMSGAGAGAGAGAGLGAGNGLALSSRPRPAAQPGKVEVFRAEDQAYDDDAGMQTQASKAQFSKGQAGSKGKEEKQARNNSRTQQRSGAKAVTDAAATLDAAEKFKKGLRRKSK